MKLRSIHVGLPKEQNMHGNMINTAIIKDRVKAPVFVSKQGVTGNKPAVHPEAVYVCPIESYQYWAKHLNVDPKVCVDGRCGENFTTEGLTEDKVHIGDILQFGQTLKTRVVGCRIPCDKFAWRVQKPTTILRETQLTGRLGYYLEVLEEGNVFDEDEIQILESHPENINISSLCQFVANHDTTLDEVNKVLTTPHLGITITSFLSNRAHHLQNKLITETGKWKGLRPFQLDKIVDEAKDIKSFYLKPTDNQPIAGYSAGQFLTVELPQANQATLTRTWSISDYDPLGKTYRISIKKLPDGLASNYMHNTAKLGDTFLMRNPVGQFTMSNLHLRPVVMISAGIGITPLLSMLKSLVATQTNNRPSPYVFWVECHQNSEHHPFNDEVTRLLNQLTHAKRFLVYTQPKTSDSQQDSVKRFELDDIKKQLKSLKIYFAGQWFEWPAQNSLYYLCGPAAFQEKVKQDLLDFGVEDNLIHYEFFHAAEGESQGHTVLQSEVTFKRSGKTLLWDAYENQTLLELAEANGLSPDFSCRMGVCQTCQCKLLKGEVYYASSPSTPVAEGMILMCIAKPGSKELILDI